MHRPGTCRLVSSTAIAVAYGETMILALLPRRLMHIATSRTLLLLAMHSVNDGAPKKRASSLTASISFRTMPPLEVI
jgi:hypothetical protein